MRSQLETREVVHISRQKDPQAFGVITVGSFQAGAAGNIIPDSAELKLTLRSYSPEVRKLLIEGVAKVANSSAEMSNAPPPTITYLHGIAAVHNDGALAARASAVLMQALGSQVTFLPATTPGYTASEDYSEYVEQGVRSVYFGIGGDDPKMLADYKAQGKPVPVNHSPYFAPVPEPTIRTGVTVLTLAVLMVTENSPNPHH
jgi:metal-dependent amidase/aminoacylase/carboxypeptidase family protein